ncbi:MAG TPA: aminoacyl-tRNA hydrolase [Candidatus Dependentiae bacterium]|nr:aminoacyl-tRNA hydrolase [Candidatus Dependentiae bacterium]HRQ63082.1 aminoacyl-tRNA hydrolase [Candidatus Dependentiae bacterium]
MNKNLLADVEIKAIIGLGNPGPKFFYQRHNIGFRVLDKLAMHYDATWQAREHMEYANISINGHQVILIKPQTFMNSSGKVIPFLLKKGIEAQHILVVHDELEQPFGKLSFKIGGSAKGHNGLRSIMEFCGQDFARLRFGIGRPERKEDVGNYVLQNFSEDPAEIDQLINDAVRMIEELYV